MAKKRKENARNENVLFATDGETNQKSAARANGRAENPAETEPNRDEKGRNFLSGLGRGGLIVAAGLCLLLVIGALGAGFGEKIFSTFGSSDSSQKMNQSEPIGGDASTVASLDPPAAVTTGTPQLSKEYVYAGSRMLAVENVGADSVPALGYEGDVWPRPNGDGSVTSTDVSVVQGFQVGNGLPYQGNEFQRADCAPFATRGDGQITSIDVSQVQAYQLGYNRTSEGTQQPAAGPTAPGGGPNGFESDAATNYEKTKQLNEQIGVPAGRGLRVVSAVITAGQTVTMLVNVDAAGDESVYGFSLNYDPAKLSNPIVTIGTAGGKVASNTTQAGVIGVSVLYENGGTIAAGINRNLIKIQFQVAANAPAGTTALTFGDTPTLREMAGAPSAVGGVKALPTNFTDSVMTVTATTTATSVLAPQSSPINAKKRKVRNKSSQ